MESHPPKSTKGGAPGKRAIPQFVIDGESYQQGEGFLYEEVSKRLGIPEP